MKGEPQKPFSGRYDVVVVGAGIAAAAAAFASAKAGKRALLLPGYRADSHRNAISLGALAPWTGLSLARVLENEGVGKARRLADFFVSAVVETKKIIQEYRLSCEYTEAPFVVLGQTPQGSSRVQKEHAAWRSVGVPVEWLEPSELADTYPMLPPSGAVRFNGHGALNAQMFAEGLALAASKMGVAVGKDVSYLSFREYGDGVVVETSQGSVEAGSLCLTTGADTSGLYQTACVTEPVPLLLGWSHGECLSNVFPLPDRSRWLPDGRILFTSARTRMFGTGEMFSHEAARLLGRLFDAFYVMRRPRVTSTWTYPVAHMMNVSPTLTCLGKRVTSVSEGGGDQTALAFLAGMSAAKMMLGEPVPYEELLFPRNKKSLQRWVAGISSSWLQRISTEMCLDNDRALDAKARDVVRPSWL